MLSRILVPMGGSEMAERALEFALETHPEAEITVLHVVGKPTLFMGEATSLALADDLPSAAEDLASDVFDRAREIAAEHDSEIQTEVAIGQPSRKIVERADGFDLVVIGSHGRNLQSHVLMGNTAKKVTRRSPVPVLTVR